MVYEQECARGCLCHLPCWKQALNDRDRRRVRVHLRSPAFCGALAQLQECDCQGALCSVLKQPHLHNEAERLSQ